MKRLKQLVLLIAALVCSGVLAADGPVTPSPSPTAVNPLVGHFTVKVYNSAGEVMADVFEGVTSSDPTGIRVAYDPIPLFGTTAVSIFLDGINPAQTIQWNGYNVSGQPAPAGIYYVKVVTQDADGSTPTLVVGLTTFGPTSLKVTVYNAAGEMVRQLFNGAITAAPTSMSLSAATLIQGSSPVTVLLSGQQPANAPITWDGTDSNGLTVTPGSYVVQATCLGGGIGLGPYVVNTLPLTVLPPATPTPSPTPTSGAVINPPPVPIRLKQLAPGALVPNPATHGRPICLSLSQAPEQAQWDVFTLTGAKVAHLDFGDQFYECWPTNAVVSGIYLIHIDQRYHGGHHVDRWLKAAVIR